MQSLQTTNGQITKHIPIYDQMHTQKFVSLNLLRVKAKQFACQNISQTVELHKFVIQEARSDQL